MINICRALLLLFCFFPFIGINIGTDTQPFALLTAILVLLMKRYIHIEEKTYTGGAIIILLVLSFVSLFAVSPFLLAKRLFSYLSIIIIPTAVYNCFSISDLENIEIWAKRFIIIWFVVGFIQSFVFPNFLTFLVPLYRTSAARGVCGLASEPSFYGYMCFLFFLIALDFKTGQLKYCMLSVIQIVIFAQSTVTIFCFGILAMTMSIGWLISLKPKNIIKIVSIAFVFGILIYMVIHFYPHTRMSFLLENFISKPSDFFKSDASVNFRFNDIIQSFSHYGVPTYLGSIVIMSGFGGMIYEMGYFSLLIIIPIIRAVYNAQYNVSRKIGICMAVFVCMLSAINLSSPMFAFYVGLCVIRSHNDKSITTNASKV